MNPRRVWMIEGASDVMAWFRSRREALAWIARYGCEHDRPVLYVRDEPKPKKRAAEPCPFCKPGTLRPHTFASGTRGKKCDRCGEKFGPDMVLDDREKAEGAAAMMSRRDRAACVLALECLRCCDGVTAGEVLNASLRDGPLFAVAVTWNLWARALADRDDFAVRRYGSWDLLRARVCLFLRALMRAEAGDTGPVSHIYGWRCGWCGGPHGHMCSRPVVEHLPAVRPLWQSPNIASRAAEARKRRGKA